MTEIKVVNKYHIGNRPMKPPEGTIRAAVHRSTPLGNPFKMVGPSPEERDRVCDAYEQWLPPKLLEVSGIATGEKETSTSLNLVRRTK